MKTITLLSLTIGILSSSTIFAQDDKKIRTFVASIEQEKKAAYIPAITTMLTLEDTTSYEAVLRLGWLNYKAGSEKKSLNYYTKAISLMPKAIEPRYGFCFPAYLLEDYKDLIIQYTKTLEIDPSNKLLNGNLGSIHYYAKDYAKALPHFQKINTQYPFDYENNLNLGWTYSHLGKHKEAEEIFNTVLLYSPKDVSATDGLSSIKRTAPLDEKVLNAFSKSYELASKSDYKGSIDPLKEIYKATDYVSNLRLGYLYYMIGQQVESASYYKIATELKPTAIEPKLGSTLPADAAANTAELKTIYASILALDPQNTSVHYKLGMLDYTNKEYAPALAHFEKIVQLYPCDVDGLLMQAWSIYQLGRTSESKTIFSKVLCLSPGNASALEGMKAKPVGEVKKSTSNPLIKIN